MSNTAANEHARLNYDAFVASLSQYLADHEGKYALLRDAKVVDFFDDAAAAYFAGMQKFTDELFSVQQVATKPVDLGFLSYADNQRFAR